MAATVIKASEKDNVAMILQTAAAGTTVAINGVQVTLQDTVEANHKFALRDIQKGDRVIKYGHSIGTATVDIKQGQWVHTHNLGE